MSYGHAHEAANEDDAAAHHDPAAPAGNQIIAAIKFGINAASAGTGG